MLRLNAKSGDVFAITDTDSGSVTILKIDRVNGNTRVAIDAPQSIRIERESVTSPTNRALIEKAFGPQSERLFVRRGQHISGEVAS